VTPSSIFRGPTHVIMLGEKFLNPANYTSGADGGDNESLFVGQDNDLFRTTLQPPLQDVIGIGNGWQMFGSAHPGGCNFSAADGSIHFISYEVNASLFAAFGVCTAQTQGSIWD